MGKENLILQMAAITMEAGRKMKCMDKEPINGMMVENLQGGLNIQK